MQSIELLLGLNMIRALIFDLDDTLVDRTTTMRRFLVDQYQRYSDRLSSSANDFVESVLKKQERGYTDKYLAYRQSCAALNENDDLPELLYDDLKENYGSKTVLFPEAKNILSTLAKRYTLALITNGRIFGQNAKLKSAGIHDLFAVIKISEIEGIKKPDPKMFKSCLDELGIKPGQSIFIGDNPANDIAPAKAVGMKAIWLRNNEFAPPKKCDGVIDKLSDLYEIIEIIDSRTNTAANVGP